MRKSRGNPLILAFAIMIIVVLTVFITDATQAQQKEKVTRWRGQYYISTKIAPYGPFSASQAGVGNPVMATYIKWLQEASNGRLVIDMAEPGAICPVPDTFDTVKKGVINLAFSSGSFHLGKLPESSLETLPFLAETPVQEYDLYYNWGLYKGLKEVYAENNLNWFPVQTNSLVGIGTTFPAPTPEALKGRKIRAVGEMGAYMAMLGASPVSIPWGEIYMALKLGTVDGFVGGSGILEEQKLKEVIKFFVTSPTPYWATINLLINMDSFKALPKDLQVLIERDSRYLFAVNAYGWEQQCSWALTQAKKQYGMQVQAWSNEDINKVRKMAAEKIWPGVAAKSARTARLLEMAKKQLREYGKID